jgi:hypothetical protein
VEALLFILDSFAMVIVVYMALRDDRRPPGAPQTSIFRTFDDKTIERPQTAAPTTSSKWRDRAAASRTQ